MSGQDTTGRYSHCAAPIRVGGVTFRNRITRTAHGTGYATGGKVSERLIAYHEARAREGVGSLFLETSGVHPTSPGPLWAFRDDIVAGGSELAPRGPPRRPPHPRRRSAQAPTV